MGKAQGTDLAVLDETSQDARCRAVVVHVGDEQLAGKALRQYHDVGLLESADVDIASGYRHYSTAQLGRAEAIRRFRALDMSIDDRVGCRLGACHNPPSDAAEEAPMGRQYVGIDVHRRRSVIVRLSGAGEKLSSVRVANDPLAIAGAVAEAGSDPEVVVEATYEWYWVVDLLQANMRDQASLP